MSDEEIELEDEALALAAGGYATTSSVGYDPTTNTFSFDPPSLTVPAPTPPSLTPVYTSEPPPAPKK